MKKIELTQGYETIVDDEFYDELIKYTWHVDIASNGSNIYAKNTHLGKMHRFIMRLCGVKVENFVVDHINGNGLDNRVENIRIVHNKRENTRNTKKRKLSKHSQYIGVTFREHAGKWCAKIRANGENVFLGYYDTAEDAGMAYDRAVLFYFPKEDTILNFPERKNEHDLSSPYERQYKHIKETNTSGYRGVHVWSNKKGLTYRASINFGGRHGKKIHLGTYNTAEDAAYAYDLARICIDETMEQNTPREHLNFKKHDEEDLDRMMEFVHFKL